MEEMKSRYLIFGATGGIGEALSQLLSEQGDSLVLVGRSSEKLDRLAEKTKASAVNDSLEDWNQATEIVNRAQETLGGLDGIAVCIGSVLLKPAHLTSPEEFQSVLNTNLTTTFGILRAGAKAMFSSGGSIVLMASAAAHIGIANHEAIGAAKAGVAGLMRSAAATYAPRGIRVNCVSPGLVETPLTERLLQTSAGRAASEKMHPLGRIGRTQEVARAIAWLLSPEQSWVTGQDIGVDGGLSAVLPRATAR